MTKTGILLVGILFASTSILIGCETEPTNGAGGSGGSETTSSSSSSSSSSGMGGTGGAGGGSNVAVEKYCTDIMANCTGANAQYPSKDSCMNAASAFPAGMAADTTTNTLACRQYHVGAAGTMAATQATHCPHAGPAGGGAAFCGTTCEGFCDIAVAECPKEWPVKADCLTACAAIPTAVMNYNTSITSGDSIECRLYHLSVAATDATSAGMHCEHSLAVSTQCK